MGFAKAWFKRDDDGTWTVVLFIVLVPVLLVGLLLGISAASDNGRVPSALAAAQQETGVMVCKDGTIDHGDSWLDRLFTDGRFRCSSWRMRAKVYNPATGATTWPSSPKR